MKKVRQQRITGAAGELERRCLRRYHGDYRGHVLLCRYGHFRSRRCGQPAVKFVSDHSYSSGDTGDTGEPYGHGEIGR